MGAIPIGALILAWRVLAVAIVVRRSAQLAWAALALAAGELVVAAIAVILWLLFVLWLGLLYSFAHPAPGSHFN